MLQSIKTLLLKLFMPAVYITAWILKKMGRYKIIGRWDGNQFVPYLERFYLFRTKPFAIFIHKFWSGDSDIYLHQHPWAFGNIILCGSYDEVMLDGLFIRKPGYFRLKRNANEYHRILLAPGTEGKVWTLFWRWRKSNRWGFLVNGKFIDAEVYLNNKDAVLEND